MQIVATSGGDVLVVLGTSGADSIIVSESGSTFTVITGSGSQSITDTLAGIAVYGFGGGDTIRLDHTVATGLVSVIYETTGNNTMSDAGADLAYLFAGSGNDTMITVGGGADVLQGGSGVDSFWFDSTDSLLGSTSTETAQKTIHKITAFAQPTTNSAQAISLEIAGQSLVEPTADYAYSSAWVNQPLFVGTPKFNDIAQGQVGDCYFLAALSSLAENDPGLIQQSIVALGDGSYAVRFYQNGSETYYRVDAQLPSNGGSPWYAKLTPQGALWVALEEKAFAQERFGQNDYSSLASGWMDEGYRAVTGASYTSQSTSGSADTLAQSMANSLAAGHAVTAASPGGSPAPIIGNHAYNVYSVFNQSGVWYVTVYNPWGFDGTSWDSNSSDGLLTLTASQFQSCFSTVETCSA
jgi:hypothetical protein